MRIHPFGFKSLLVLIAVGAVAGRVLAQDKPVVPKVGIIPWAMNGGTETAVETAHKALNKLFENAGYEAINPVEVNAVWRKEMDQPIPDTTLGEQDSFADLPKPKDALALGRRLGVDLVCVGRLRWHTKSVWVSLGPKTKAEATIDCMVIDVAKGEILLDQKGVISDSTRKESGLETAAALLVTWGVTAFSGGPKTPHQEKAAVNAIALAFDPWLKTMNTARKKIG